MVAVGCDRVAELLCFELDEYLSEDVCPLTLLVVPPPLPPPPPPLPPTLPLVLELDFLLFDRDDEDDDDEWDFFGLLDDLLLDFDADDDDDDECLVDGTDVLGVPGVLGFMLH